MSREAEPLQSGSVSEAARSIRMHLLLAFLLGAVVNVLFLASPLYMMQLYGRVLNARSIETLVSLTIALVLVLVLMGAADAARGRLLARAAGRVAVQLAPPVTQRALAEGTGRAAADLAEVEAIRRFLGGGAGATLMDAPFTLLFLCVLFLLHPLLGLAATVGAVVILLVIAASRLVEVRRDRRIAEASRHADGLTAALGGDRGEIRALGLAPGLAARVASGHDSVTRLRLAQGDAAASVGATTRTLRLAAHSGALATGAALAIEGALAPSAMLAAAILAGRALGPIEALPGALRSATRARAAAATIEDRLGRVPDRPPAPAGAPRPATVDVRRLVAVPAGATRAALRSISFSIAAGEVVSIAGPSGAGKSTLLRCLAGADAIRSGEVRIAGRDVGSGGVVTGWLPQEVPLYPGTVRDNIARFAEAPDEAVHAAAERAGALAVIERLPQGFSADIDAAPTGAGLRQAIGLARALLPRPDLLLLDQPTAHLDAAGEVAAMNAIRALKAEGVTIVLVSHKPVLATLADRIMLMQDGTIEVFEDRDVVLNALRRRSIRPVDETAEAAR
jgi:ATP-binding cassette subfamily C exporter for protease/lipase